MMLCRAAAWERIYGPAYAKLQYERSNRELMEQYESGGPISDVAPVIDPSPKAKEPDPRAALQHLPPKGQCCVFCGQPEDHSFNNNNLFTKPAIWDSVQKKAIWVDTATCNALLSQVRCRCTLSV